MADILIRGFEMPKNDSIIVAIRSDGKIEDVMGCYIGTAVELPPHGDLVDKNELRKWSYEVKTNRGKYQRVINVVSIPDLPVVVPANE